MQHAYGRAGCDYVVSLSNMPRSQVSSVARVYPNVNAERGPSWYEYGGYNRAETVVGTNLTKCMYRQFTSSMGNAGSL